MFVILSIKLDILLNILDNNKLEGILYYGINRKKT